MIKTDNKPSELEVKKALRVILSDKRSLNTSLNWAVNYIKTGLYLSGEDLRVQCLYVLNNITHWRHPEAKNVRKVLKSFAGVK